MQLMAALDSAPQTLLYTYSFVSKLLYTSIVSGRFVAHVSRVGAMSAAASAWTWRVGGGQDNTTAAAHTIGHRAQLLCIRRRDAHITEHLTA
jgi:hypothetical protein